MQVRVSRNLGSNGANEWRADPPDPRKHYPVIFYTRVILLENVTFDTKSPNIRDGWAVGEAISADGLGSAKGPKFAITEPEIYGLENGEIERLPVEGWVPFRFVRGTGFVTLHEQRVLRGGRRVLLGPGFASVLDPAF
jgi:hypothetical protein